MIGFRSVLSSGGGSFNLDSLVITSPATKNTYVKGDSIDLTGLVVTGTIGRMSGNVTQDCSVYPTTLNILGEQTITLSYGGLSVNYNVNVTNELRIVSWADGTDEEIAAMLRAYYDDELDIYSCEGWEIGAERTVQLSAMSATGVSESHVAQTVKFMLMDRNVRDLVTPVNGHTKCAFVVGQTSVLKNGSTIEAGYIHPTANTNNGGWTSTARRTWCNEVYRESLPNSFKRLFKQFKYLVNNGLSNGNQIIELSDYFTLPSRYEVFGTGQQEGTQLAKYAQTAVGSSPKAKDGYYWTRTASNDNGYWHCFYQIYPSGDPSYSGMGTCTRADYFGFSPEGVI